MSNRIAYLFNLDSGVLHGINNSGLEVVKMYVDGKDEQSIVNALVSEFGEGQRAIIEKTVRTFLSSLRENRLLPQNTRVIAMPDSSIPPLLTVQLDLSWNCNLHCRHCYLGDKTLRDEPLSYEEWQNVILQLADMGVPKVAFLGGEPLLYPYFFKLVEFASKQGLRVYTTTNGTLVTQRVCQRFVESGFTEIDVSLDGATGDTHEFLRGKGTFEKTVRSIKLLSAFGLKIKSSTVVHKTNFREIESLLSFGREIGINAMYFNTLLPSGEGKGLEDQVIGVSDWQQVKNQLREWNTKRLRPKAFSEYFFLFDDCDSTNNHNAFCYTGCKAGKRELIITPDGYAAVCPMVSTDREYQSMSVRNHSIIEIWKNDPWVLKLRSITSQTLNLTCKDCEHAEICTGGCHLLALWSCGNLNAPDPRCPYSSTRKEVVE